MKDGYEKATEHRWGWRTPYAYSDRLEKLLSCILYVLYIVFRNFPQKNHLETNYEYLWQFFRLFGAHGVYTTTTTRMWDMLIYIHSNTRIWVALC